MKSFGKFTPHPHVVTLPPMQVGADEDGTPIMGDAVNVTILIFKDKNGVDIIDVAKANPHPFYIAINDYGTVVSMTDDIEKSQIAGFEIIGIDSDFDFTSGPGGTVYGKVWNGTAIVEPPVVEPTPDEISRRQFFQQLAVQEIITNADALAAMRTGVIPAPLQAIIDTLPEANQFEAQMLVIGADTFSRAHPLTEVVRLALGWTEEQRDQFWRDAYKL